ncbi:hypothetical protein B0H13DRAFT_2333252 [Mycena leptocephala]|nr:hypothetical protein B0H13DRAFT_2333252 [Mycena leptocephala]
MQYCYFPWWEPKKIFENITKNMYEESNLDETRTNKAHRRDFVTRADVRRIQKMIEEESIRLAAQDGPSVLAWAEKLREGHFVSLKRSDESAPAGSQLDDDSFVLIGQTKYQRECWQKYGSTFAGIYGTHNTTYYLNMTLFTLLVRDKWGHAASIPKRIYSFAGGMFCMPGNAISLLNTTLNFGNS